MFVVRHPEVKDPLKQTGDTPPDAEGKVQAIKVASFFKGRPVKKIYSSPAKRTRYQADSISKVTGVPVEEDSRLQTWPIKASSEDEYNRKLNYYTKNPDEKPPETDETFNQFRSRVASFHAEHASEPGTVAVTHSKNIMTHKDLAVGSGVGSDARDKIRNTKVSKIGIQSFRPELILKNSPRSGRDGQ